MSKQDLQNSLNQLRTEIEALTGDNQTDRERLVGLIESVEHQIDAEIDSSEDDSTFSVEGLRGYAEKFEVEHPKITQTLNDIMTTLSNLGI